MLLCNRSSLQCYSQFQLTFHRKIPNFVPNFANSLPSSKVHNEIHKQVCKQSLWLAINSFSTYRFRITLRHNFSNINKSHHWNPHKITFRTGGGVKCHQNITQTETIIYLLTAWPKILKFISRKSWISLELFVIVWMAICVNTLCIQALSCTKFRLNTASRNIYFEFFKMSGYTRTRVHCAIIGQ
jgi:hypothetical protein